METKLSIYTVIALILVTALGSGGVVWEWQRIHFDKLRTDLAVAEQTTKLREELDKIFVKVIETSRNFVPLDLCSGKNRNQGIQLQAQLKLYKDNFNTLESKLSALEHREARDINLDVIALCPPSGLSVK
jgi:hypothetical protein